MSRGKAHLKDVKAKALAALIAGDTPTEVAAKYGLHRETVRNWNYL
jgi:Homeodomain-like domain-containing protein